jgi:hypothetical protein
VTVTASAADSTKLPVATETNFSSDFDVFVRKSQPGITAYAEERVFEVAA